MLHVLYLPADRAKPLGQILYDKHKYVALFKDFKN